MQAVYGIKESLNTNMQNIINIFLKNIWVLTNFREQNAVRFSLKSAYTFEFYIKIWKSKFIGVILLM